MTLVCSSGLAKINGRESAIFMDRKQPLSSWAKYFKRARTELNLTQVDLAKSWGKSQSTVSEIERDLRPIDKSDIPALAKALEKPLAEVYEAAGFLANEPNSEEFLLESGTRIRVVFRPGEPAALIRMDETALALLEVWSRASTKVSNNKP